MPQTIATLINQQPLWKFAPVRQTPAAGKSATSATRKCGIYALAFLLLLLQTAGASGVYDQLIQSGNWDISANWSQGAPPTSSLNARVDGNFTAYAPAGVSGTASILALGSASSAGTLIVNGGMVSDFQADVATEAGSSGTATVTSGTWNTTAAFYVGLSGTGTLTISDSGVVNVGSGSVRLALGQNSGGLGILNLGTGGTAGLLRASSIDTGVGTAMVNFNHTGTYVFTIPLTGSLSLNKLGAGTTVLTGTSTYYGATTVSSGGLALASHGSINNSSSITLSAGGFLDTTSLSIGTFILSGSQKFNFALDPTASGTAGYINATGLNISNAVVDFSTLGTLDDSAYVIASYKSLTGNAFGTVLDLPAGYTIDYSHNGNQIAVVSVPEPGSMVLMGLSATCLAFGRFVKKKLIQVPLRAASKRTLILNENAHSEADAQITQLDTEP